MKQIIKKIFSLDCLLDALLVIICFLSVFPLHKNIFTVPFYTDDNALRYAAGHLVHYGNFDLRFFAGHPSRLSSAYNSGNLWMFLFFVFKFFPKALVYNGTHILWFLLTPLITRTITWSLTQETNRKRVMNIFLLPFILLISVVLIWSGNLHWGVVLILLFLTFYSSQQLVFKEESIDWKHFVLIILMTALMIYINRVSLIFLVILMMVYSLLRRKNSFLLIMAILLGMIVDSPFLWKDLFYSLTQGFPFHNQNQTYIPFSPLTVMERVIRLQFFKNGNYVFWILYPINLILLAGVGINFVKKSP